MSNVTQHSLAPPPLSVQRARSLGALGGGYKPKPLGYDPVKANAPPAEYSHERHCNESVRVGRPEVKACFQLKDYHYQMGHDMHARRTELGFLDMVHTSRAAIPGYSGHIPRREATNVCSVNTKKSNLIAADLQDKLDTDNVMQYAKYGTNSLFKSKSAAQFPVTSFSSCPSAQCAHDAHYVPTGKRLREELGLDLIRFG